MILQGSSPLTRGIRTANLALYSLARFIPAHAGNTPLPTLAEAGSRVHPRSRGEYNQKGNFPSCRQGSSPLTRGIHRHDDQRNLCSGFIPAHAGNTGRYTVDHQHSEVHPRSRGEYPLLSQQRQTLQGSSPLTRGIPGQFEGVAIQIRFIPAHAGNTMS